MKKIKKLKRIEGGGSGGAVYCLGLVGSAIYFLQRADGLGEILLGLLKSIVWPGVLVYRVLEVLKM